MNEKRDEELLAYVLRSQAERVADKKLAEIAQATRRELKLTDIAYDRLMAGIELGKRVAEARAYKNDDSVAQTASARQLVQRLRQAMFFHLNWFMSTKC